jgi:hypothetical protein
MVADRCAAFVTFDEGHAAFISCSISRSKFLCETLTADQWI